MLLVITVVSVRFRLYDHVGRGRNAQTEHRRGKQVAADQL